MRRVSLGAAQAALSVLAVVALLGFLWWCLGTNVLGLTGEGALPDALQGRSDANTFPTERVVLRDGEAAARSVVEANAQLEFPSTGLGVHGAAELYSGDVRVGFVGATWSEQLAWSAVRALPLLGGAIAWWLLAGVVAAVRRGEGAGVGAVRRLRAVGVLLALGSPLVDLARHAVGRWLVQGSEAADLVTVPGVDWSPWPVAAGLTLLVLSVAWAENGRMRRDLEGLV